MTTPPSSGQWSDPGQPVSSWPAPDPSAPPAYHGYPAPPLPGSYGTVPGYGAAPAYPAAAYPMPYVVAARPTNGMALAAMIVALAGLISCIGFPVGAVLGHVALRRVRQTGEQGEAYAKTGIIVGWIGTGLGILGCGLYIVLTAIASSVNGGSTS